MGVGVPVGTGVGVATGVGVGVGVGVATGVGVGVPSEKKYICMYKFSDTIVYLTNLDIERTIDISITNNTIIRVFLKFLKKTQSSRFVFSDISGKIMVKYV